MSDLVSKLRDVNTPESRIAQSVATGAFTALVSPRKLSPRSLTTMHVLSGLLGVAGGAVLARNMTLTQQVAAGAAVGGTMAGASVVGVVVDIKGEEWLRRRGVRRPRLWMGILAGVLTWLTSKPTTSLDSLDQAETDETLETATPDDGSGLTPSR